MLASIRVSLHKMGFARFLFSSIFQTIPFDLNLLVNDNVKLYVMTPWKYLCERRKVVSFRASSAQMPRTDSLQNQTMSKFFVILTMRACINGFLLPNLPFSLLHVKSDP